LHTRGWEGCFYLTLFPWGLFGESPQIGLDIRIEVKNTGQMGKRKFILRVCSFSSENELRDYCSCGEKKLNLGKLNFSHSREQNPNPECLFLTSARMVRTGGGSWCFPFQFPVTISPSRTVISLDADIRSAYVTDKFICLC
jgi:hypothetical protein